MTAYIESIIAKAYQKFPAAPGVLKIRIEEVEEFDRRNVIGQAENHDICASVTHSSEPDIIRLFDRSRYFQPDSGYSEYDRTIGHELGHLLVEEYRHPECAARQPAKYQAAQELYDTFKTIFENEPPVFAKSNAPSPPLKVRGGPRLIGFVSEYGMYGLKRRYDNALTKLSATGATQKINEMVGSFLTAGAYQVFAERATFVVEGHTGDPVMEDLVDTIGYYILDRHDADDPIIKRKIAAIQRYAQKAYSGRATGVEAKEGKPIPEDPWKNWLRFQ